MSTTAPPVSAFMITFNNERTVETALRSLSWADELVVVDSHSTDRTPEIARRYATVFDQREWPGFRDQYQYAMDRCTHDWCVFADADEELSPALIREIPTILSRNAKAPHHQQIRGYYGHRRTWYLGRWIEHGAWVPDFELRLVDRRVSQWRGGLHARIYTDGPVAHLKHFIYHYTYADIADQLKTINDYSTTAADDMRRESRTFSWAKLVVSPPTRFVRDYILKRGFLDGFAGLVIAVNTMCYVFNKHAKLREQEKRFADSAPGEQGT